MKNTQRSDVSSACYHFIRNRVYFFFSQKRERAKSQTSMKEEIAAAGIPVTSM